MSTQLSDATASAAADAVVDRIDVSGPGSLQLWSGSMPGSTGGTPGGVLLAEIDYENPAFGAAVAGVAEALGTPLSSAGLPAAGSGTDIGFFRVVDGAGTVVWQNDNVSTSGSTGLVVNTPSVADGVTVEIVAHTYTQPTT